jgi:hypothetical protein
MDELPLARVHSVEFLHLKGNIYILVGLLWVCLFKYELRNCDYVVTVLGMMVSDDSARM